MPPKKKQGKSSKADKKRLKKEEEERRLREEEEARLIAEQEEQERLEREQREEEERLRLESKDRGRRQGELKGLHLRLMEDQEKVNMWESEARKKAEWVRYMICDGSPNPAVQAEINSFITLWKEDPNMDLQTILRQCALALRLTDELEDVLRDETDPEIVQTHQDTLEDLQRLIHAKHLGAAEEILKTSRACADIETGNMQMMVRDDDITLCLWANISKNPRFKGYDFQEAGLSFELPKQLTLSDISIRILYTRYDHLSHLSLRSQAQKKHAVREKEEKEKEEKEKEEKEAEGVAEDETLEDGEMKEGEERRENGQQEQEDMQSLKSEEGNKSRVSVRSAKEGRKSSSLKLQEEEEEHLENIVEEEGITPKDGDTPESQPTAAEPEPVHTEVQVVDLYRYTPLGGVYYFDLFQLPPQSITINNWEMTKILDTGLQHFPYPSEQPGKTEDSATQSNLPVGVSVVLPETVIFMQEPQVAWWDPDGRHWRTDGVTETSYDSETPSISFKMESFYTFTLLQETHANMPFQSWELRPQGQDTVTLTITAALTEVTFSVQGNECMLQMDEVPGLNHILGKRMSLGALQTAMTRAGVNVFVSQGSEDYVPVAAKDPLIEHAVYQQMALVSSAFAFSRSRWNSQCGQEHFVLRVCEHLEAGPVLEEAWSLYYLGAQRSQRLKLTETSEEFSTELAGNTEFHSTFLHMLRDFSSPEGRDRVDHAHYLLVNTVHRLLCATRVLTFS